MTASTTSLARMTRGTMDRLASHPDDIMCIRMLYEDFLDNADQFRENDDHLSFFLWWTYKNYAEDILRICAEDDVFESGQLTEQLTRLGQLLRASWEKGLAIQPEAHAASTWATWGEEVLRFAGVYRQLLGLRRTRSHATIGGLKFLVPQPGSQLLGLPTQRTRARKDDPTLRMFPDLDATLTDPTTNHRIKQWYTQAVRHHIQRHADRCGERVDSLCFVEKSYSVVGALTLVAELVGSLDLPATIYRRSYPDGVFRITGTPPQQGGRTILVYDVTASGEALQSAISFLRQQYEIQAVAAVVGYDFSLGARGRLAEEQVELVPFLERNAIDRGQVAAAFSQTRTRSPLSSSAAVGAAGREVSDMSSKERGTDLAAKADAVLDAVMDQYGHVIEQAEQDLHGSAVDHKQVDPTAPVRRANAILDAVMDQYGHVIEQAEQDLHRDTPPEMSEPL